MKYLNMSIVAISATMIVGCGGTVSPNVGSGGVHDKTLNNNDVDLLTLIRVENNYGTQIHMTESSNGKVAL